jgi:hypothetical protein
MYQISIIDTMDDERLFARFFQGPSWIPWRAFLKALFALETSDDDLILYRDYTARSSAPTKPLTEAAPFLGYRPSSAFQTS